MWQLASAQHAAAVRLHQQLLFKPCLPFLHSSPKGQLNGDDDDLPHATLRGYVDFLKNATSHEYKSLQQRRICSVEEISNRLQSATVAQNVGEAP